MTNRERSFWDGFIKAALSQETLDSFPPEIAQYLSQGMDVNQAYEAGGPAMQTRLSGESSKALLDKLMTEGNQQYNDFMNVKPQIPNNLPINMPNTPPMNLFQEQVTDMPATSVGAPPPSATPQTQATPVTSDTPPAQPGMPGWVPWAAGGAAIGAAGLGGWYLNKKKKEQQQQPVEPQPQAPQQKAIEPPIAQNQKKRKLGPQQAAIV